MSLKTIRKQGALAVALLVFQSGIIAAAGDDAAVVVDGVEITLADLDVKDPGALHQARTALYTAQKNVAERAIDDYLLEREAKMANITVEELLERHVNSAGGSPPSDEALRFYYEGLDITEPFEEVRDKIFDVVRKRRIDKAKTAYIESLRSQSEITFVLAPPRVEVSLEDVPVRGTPDAPVKIVEFADYECPYCRQAHPVLEQIEKEYDGKVLLAYKDFPLPNHSNARKAAEAAHCAGDQGQYWAYHDALFQTDRLEVPQLKEMARLLQLDSEAFDACLDSGNKQERVEAWYQEAIDLALPGTPGFLINGRFIEGASYEILRSAIEEELRPSTK